MHDAIVRSGYTPAELPGNWRVLYGMAGLVAEEILRGETNDPEVITQDICVRIWMGEASASDMESMNITDTDDFELNSDEVTQAWRYLLEDWKKVQQEASYLIAEAASNSAAS